MEENALVVKEDQKPARLLLATDPQGMHDAQLHLAEWFRRKIVSLNEELSNVQKSLDTAKRCKWAIGTFRNQLSRIKGNILFYGKAREAINSGYFLIPNFPVDVFAVRKSKTNPPPKGSTSWHLSEIPAEKLTIGKGEYFSSQAHRVPVDEVEEKDYKGQLVKKDYYENVNIKEVQFPVVAMKAEIMTESEKAFALKLFDDIGICPPTRRADPMIIGRIHGPKVGYTEKFLSFLICWFLEPDSL